MRSVSRNSRLPIGPRPLGPLAHRLSSERPENAAHPFRGHRAKIVDDGTPQNPLARDPVLASLEAILMMADEPVSPRRLAEICGLHGGQQACQLIDALRERYTSDDSAYQIEELAGGFQLLTNPVIHPWLLRFRRSGSDVRLSSATLETLAVIAYKQPLTRAEIETVRGVQCSDLIRVLMEKGLVRVTGRHESLGRPQLYGTSKGFLQAFGLNTLSDLPTVETLRPTGQN